MNYLEMNDSEILELMRGRLFDGTDAEFKQMLVDMKAAGLSQTKVYQCMLMLWDELNVNSHDKALDRLANWISVVTGHVVEDCRVWETRLA
jgi:hypothetical protein